MINCSKLYSPSVAWLIVSIYIISERIWSNIMIMIMISLFYISWRYSLIVNYLKLYLTISTLYWGAYTFSFFLYKSMSIMSIFFMMYTKKKHFFFYTFLNDCVYHNYKFNFLTESSIDQVFSSYIRADDNFIIFKFDEIIRWYDINSSLDVSK